MNRHRGSDSQREPRIGETERPGEPPAPELQRPDPEERCREKRAGEVVDTERGGVPAVRGTPRHGPGGGRERGEATCPGEPAAAQQQAREPQREKGRAEREENVHGNSLLRA